MVQTQYVSTLPGILKIVEAVLCLAGFISAMIPYSIFTPSGGGWTQFVTITALFGVIGILVAYTCLAHQLPQQFPLMVMIFYIVYDVFLLIAGILTAVRAGQIYTFFRYRYYGLGYPYQSVAACAFFVLVAFIVFVLDTVMSVNAWRSSTSSGGATSQTTSSHVTTTTTTSKSTVVVS